MFGLASAFSQTLQRQAGAFGVKPRVHTFGQAQRVHQELEGQFFIAQGFLAGQEAFGWVEVVLGQAGFPGAHNTPVRMAELAVGARADADEVAETPVIEVMPRRSPGLGVGRDFVLAVAMFGQQRLPGFLDVPQRVVLLFF